jgi:5-methylcytosine-specific restriction endonuclease McrA
VATPSSSEQAAPREHLELTLWVSREFLDELEEVRSLLSHAVPSGKREEVLLHVLKAQRKVIERQRYGSPKQSKTSATRESSDPSHITAAVRREVHDRDEGCCAFIGEGGRRCRSKHQLEYQHIIPVARGGRSTVDNVALFCRAHNQLEARREFGEEHVKRKQLESKAIRGLINLGYKRNEAAQAVAAAVKRMPPDSELDAVMKESLRILTPR